jgi:hypothetical protein
LSKLQFFLRKENGKLRPIETILRMEEGNNETGGAGKFN